MDEHLLRQIREGEFAILADQARAMTAEEFAAAHGVTPRLVPPGEEGQHKVAVGGCEYFWDPDTGRFDGWGRMA